jgi:hypothetical protein
MKRVRIQRVTAESAPAESAQAERVARRVAELLGQQLAAGEAVAPRPRLALDLTVQPGLSEEQMARKIARELKAKL